MLRVCVVFLIAVSAALPTSQRQRRRPASSRAATTRASASRPAASRPASLTAIKDVSHDMLRKRVAVEGVIDDIVTKPSRTRERIYIYTLRQDDHKIEFVWWEDFAAKLSPERTPRKGQRVRIRGRVDEFNGKIQLRPSSPSDIDVLK